MAVVIIIFRISFVGLQPKWLQKRIVRLFIVNRGKWLRSPVNIKQTNKLRFMLDGPWPSTSCSMLIDSAWIT